MAFQKHIRNWEILISIGVKMKTAITVMLSLLASFALGFGENLEVVKIPGAKLLVVNYASIREDIPSLRMASEAKIDEWIQLECFYLKATQIKNNRDLSYSIHGKVDYEIPKRSVRAFSTTPSGKGRGLIFETNEKTVENEPLFLDGKGFGAVDPGAYSHSHGLMTTGEGLREYLYSLILQKIFDHSGSRLKAGKVYAVIDWGFDVQNTPKNWVPAGAVIRPYRTRWHQPGYIGENNFLDEVSTVIVETVLRFYGFKSSGEGLYRLLKDGRAGERLGDVANVQGTLPFLDGRIGPIIDFGAFLHGKSEEELTHYFYHWEATRSKDSGGTISEPAPLLSPQIPGFPMSNSMAVAALSEQWGVSEGLPQDPQYDRPFIDSHSIVNKWRAGKANRFDILNFIKSKVGDILLPQEISGRFTNIQSTESRLKILSDILGMQVSRRNLSEITVEQWVNTPGTVQFKELNRAVGDFILSKRPVLFPLINKNKLLYEQFKDSIESQIALSLESSNQYTESFGSTLDYHFGFLFKHYFEYTTDPNGLLLNRIRVYLQKYQNSPFYFLLQERKEIVPLNESRLKENLSFSRDVFALILEYRPNRVTDFSQRSDLSRYEYLVIQNWVEANPIRLANSLLVQYFLENSTLPNNKKKEVAKFIFENLDKWNLSAVLHKYEKIGYKKVFAHASDWNDLYQIFLKRFPDASKTGTPLVQGPSPSLIVGKRFQNNSCLHLL